MRVGVAFITTAFGSCMAACSPPTPPLNPIFNLLPAHAHRHAHRGEFASDFMVHDEEAEVSVKLSALLGVPMRQSQQAHETEAPHQQLQVQVQQPQQQEGLEGAPLAPAPLQELQHSLQQPSHVPVVENSVWPVASGAWQPPLPSQLPAWEDQAPPPPPSPGQSPSVPSMDLEEAEPQAYVSGIAKLGAHT
jgi:hypothetical protein